MKYWVVFYTIQPDGFYSKSSFAGITRDYFEVYEDERGARDAYAQKLAHPNLYCAGWGPIAGGTDWEAE